MPDTKLYIGFSRSTGGFFSRALGWLIRRASGSWVNHAFCLYYDTYAGCWMTVGANANGVGPIPLDRFQRSRRIVDLWAPAIGSFWDGYHALHDKIGVPYNYSGCANMLFVEFARKLGVKDPRNWLSNPADEFCSEYCAEIVSRSNLPSPAAAALQETIALEPPSTIDPGMLRKLFWNSGAMQRYSLASIVGASGLNVGR